MPDRRLAFKILDRLGKTIQVLKKNIKVYFLNLKFFKFKKNKSLHGQLFQI
jgi:hypothetical protein